MAMNSVTKRDRGACLHDLRVEPRREVGGLEPLVDERAHHRQQQRHQQRGRAALAGDVAERQQHAAVGERQDVVEVAADRVGRPGHPERLDARRAKLPRAAASPAGSRARSRDRS